MDSSPQIHRFPRAWRRGLTVCLALALSLLPAAWAPPAASAPAAPKIGPGVREAIHAQGQARVMIALQTPGPERQASALPELRQAVAALRANVLAGVEAGGFRESARYAAVPALAGAILSERALDQLAAHPSVARIDLDVGGTGALDGSVPLIGANQWHALGVDAEDVVVAVLDTGIDTDHADLADDLIHQACFLDFDGSINGVGQCPNGSDRQVGPGAAEDGAGHGTHVSGIITSGGQTASVGVAPGADIVAIKVLDNTGYAGTFAFYSEVVAALDYVLNSRPDVQVINMSLGTNALFAGDCDGPGATAFNLAGADAINALRANGVIAFASAGNNGSGTEMTSPACLSSVIAVGATDYADDVAIFSNSNASTDLMAPGSDILSAAIGGGTVAAWGTSMASPHAAGCAALLIAAGEATTPDQIEARLESSAVSVTDATNGLSFPRIQCAPRAPAALSVAGPVTGTVGAAYTFTATTSPITATQPVTYVWEATGQAPITHTAGLTDTLAYTWAVAGPQAITVTAASAAGTVTGTHAITLTGPIAVALGGPLTGTVGITQTFSAAVSPLTATLPVTYVWEATGQATITRTAGLTDSVELLWVVPGPQTVSVTASNADGAVRVRQAIMIVMERRVFLPLSLK